jgi:hypothetical protein
MGATTYGWQTLFLEFKTMAMQLEHYMFMQCRFSTKTLWKKKSVGLQELFLSRLCSQEENYFFLHALSMILIAQTFYWEKIARVRILYIYYFYAWVNHTRDDTDIWINSHCTDPSSTSDK